jgi:hypothetical protein
LPTRFYIQRRNWDRADDSDIRNVTDETHVADIQLSTRRHPATGSQNVSDVVGSPARELPVLLDQPVLAAAAAAAAAWSWS